MKIIFAVFGFVFLGLGVIGIVLPMIPTTPFIMISAFCFAKSSKKLNDWFLSTKIYKKYFEQFINKKAMTVKTKLTVMISITSLLCISFIIMKNVLMAQIVIAIVWICHIIYFMFRIQTIRE